MGSSRVSVPEICPDTIKSIVSIHRAIFHVYIEHDSHAPIKRIKKTDAVPPETAPTYTIVVDDKARGKSGIGAFPPGTSSTLYTSVLKWEMCDFAVQAFVKSMQKQLDLWAPGTKVDWITADVKPLIHFRMQTTKKYEAPRHSMFLITVPDSDEETEIIADFTIEQFGYGGDCWYAAMDEYLDKVAATREYSMLNVEEETRQIRETEWWEDLENEGMTRLSKICEEMKWKEVIEMAPDVRVGYLYKLYEYSEYLVAGLMSMKELHKICLESYADAKACIPCDG